MRSKTLYEIETTEESFNKDKNSKEIAKKLLIDHGIKPGDRQVAKLSGWIARANGKRVDDIYNYREYDGSLNIPPNINIILPKERNGILYIISDGKIMNRDLLKEVDIKIGKYKEQQTASCFNFANGGVRYEFKIEESKHWATPRVMFCKDGSAWRHFSQGKFVHLNGDWDSEKRLINEEGKLRIIERMSSFEKEGIEIVKVAASNSRAICYGKDKDGKHRFFWAQLADSFPDEPLGVSIPGVYVASADGREQEMKDRYRYIFHLYDREIYKHPAWAMQVLGGKITNLIDENKEVIKKIKELYNDMATIIIRLWKELDKLKGEKQSKKVFLTILKAKISQNDDIKRIKAEIENLKYKLYNNTEVLPVMPIVVDNECWYEISLPIGQDGTEIDKVLDIGVSDIERYEHYKTEHGGEVQCWLYDEKLEDYKNKISIFTLIGLVTSPVMTVLQKAGKDLFNAVITHLAPNLKAHDGMGFNDGTCNFFFLAKMRKNGSFPKYSVFWCDEQEGFSERWRNLHPEDSEFKGVIGTAFSVFPAIDTYYKVKRIGDKKIWNFEDNFVKELPYNKLNDDSRMAVSRNPILFSTNECIYSISYMWGVTDFKWNSRPYPEKGISFNSTLGIRDDTTVYIMGFYYDEDCDEYISGYFYQKYIPQSIYKKNLARENYSAAPFQHRWYFLSEETFKSVDKYYNFLIYDAYDEEKKLTGGYRPIREEKRAYCYRGVEDRAQYYVVDVDWGESKNELIKHVKEGEKVWKSLERPAPVNPFYSTIDPDQKNQQSVLEHSIKLTLRWDNVRGQVIALFTNPCDDDIPFHMDRDMTVSEILPPELGKFLNEKVQDVKEKNMIARILLDWGHSEVGIQYYNLINYDLKGRWSCGKKIFKLKFDERVRCYSSPSVKKVELELKKGNDNDSVAVTIITDDESIRYITIGAVVNGRGRRISVRYELSASELYTGGFFGIGQEVKSKIELEIPLLSSKELGIEDKTLEEYFYRDAQIAHGTSIWFEDILGHKGIAEEFEIKGEYWKTLGKVYFDPNLSSYREEDRATHENKIEEITTTIKSKYSNKHVKITGHCASINRPNAEEDLSIERASKVYSKITNKLMGYQRGEYQHYLYSYEGKGATAPASSNSTAEGMKNNRRVVVKVLVKD